MLKATVDQKKEYQIEQKDGKMLLDGAPFDWDLSPLAPGKYHVIRENQSYSLEVVEADFKAKSLQIKVNGKLVEVSLQDHMDLLLEKLGIDANAGSAISDLKAPMPGLVLDVFVKPGDVVAKGDRLVVLEAMKMENILKAEGEGEVKDILITKGDSVEKNQVMIQF